MAVPPVVGLEIGTSKCVALVGELREDGHIMVVGMGEQPSVGLRKGEVIDLENATSCVQSALAQAEESGRVEIREVFLAVTGGHLRSLINRGSAPVMDPQGEIGADDVRQVMEIARAVNLPSDREILHTVCRHFQIDDQQRVLRPEGMEGARLSVDMLVLHGVRSRLHNTVRVARSVPVGVADVVFAGLGSALAVLTPEQKRGGAVVIDCGGGTTDYLAYADGVVAAAGAMGVGGDHVTNDIALAFNIPMSQAERLKCDAGAAVVDSRCGETRRLSVPAELGFAGRTVSVPALNTVIHARVDEILRAISGELRAAGVLHHIGAGVLFTGGGAHLRGLGELGGRVFGLPCAVGKPLNLSGLATATEGPAYATAGGLLEYGFRAETNGRRAPALSGWIRELFRR